MNEAPQALSLSMRTRRNRQGFSPAQLDEFNDRLNAAAHIGL